MTETTDDRNVNELTEAIRGRVLAPDHPDYDEARRVHNGMIDRRPAVIARCQGTADVVAAVNHARVRGLEIAVRGGGHNVAGNAVCDGGLCIDLSEMKGIHIDPQTKTARVQGGVTWAELNRETQLHGLAVTGGLISSTGIAGLTLGGGLGWLMGKHGLTADNLRSAEVVTPAGKVVTASANENADLFWALRGGGGNFGVVTSFEYDLHPVGPLVTGGLVAHPFESAPEVLRFYRDFTRSLSDDLTAFAGLLHSPDGSGTRLAVMILCHCGSPETAEAEVGQVKEFGSPIMDTVGPISYQAVNAMLDDGFPKGALNYWKSSFLRDFGDAVIDTMIAQFASCPSPMSGLLVEHIHGAAVRRAAADTAFPHRQEGFNFLTAAEWLDRADNDANVAWARQTDAAMEPYMAAGGYANYFAGDEGADRVAAAYGANFERLREIKRRYDPENLFHLNQNIRP